MLMMFSLSGMKPQNIVFHLCDKRLAFVRRMQTVCAKIGLHSSQEWNACFRLLIFSKIERYGVLPNPKEDVCRI